MIKSFYISGGTCFSTNWGEISQTDHEKKKIAPKCAEWKIWEGERSWWMVGVGGYFILSLIFKYWYFELVLVQYCICNSRLQEVIKVPVLLSCIIPACLKSTTEVTTLNLLYFVKRKHVRKRQKCLLKHLVCCTCILGEYSITCYLVLSAISYLHKTSVDILPNTRTWPQLRFYYSIEIFDIT